MLTKIEISNFRSIKNISLDLAPLTVLYGPTASGKSSPLYSLIVLKNFINNPAQHSDGFFNLGFMSLSGFDDCVFNKEKDSVIKIKFHISQGCYELSLSKNMASINLFSKELDFRISAEEIMIPYNLNKNFTKEFFENDIKYIINWNGINFTINPEKPIAEYQQRANELTKKLNSITDYIKKIDIVPHKRGFFKANYSPVSIGLIPTSEDEVASLIINDLNLAPKISVDLEKILNRDFRTYTPPGTAVVFFQSTDKNSRIPVLLVNEGFGVNQIVYMLAKIHRSDIKTILIEEPEVHLHPKIIKSLTKTLISIIKEEKKQIILTTHSEVIVSSILFAIKKSEIKNENIKCYLVTKEGKNTNFKEQRVSENGQIEGGLQNFMSSELEELLEFLD